VGGLVFSPPLVNLVQEYFRCWLSLGLATAGLGTLDLVTAGLVTTEMVTIELVTLVSDLLFKEGM
jgi:hypothetical protein